MLARRVGACRDCAAQWRILIVFSRSALHEAHFTPDQPLGRCSGGGQPIQLDRPAYVAGQVVQPDPRLGARDADAAHQARTRAFEHARLPCRSRFVSGRLRWVLRWIRLF